MNQVIYMKVRRWSGLDFWILALFWIFACMIGGITDMVPMPLAMLISLILWIGIECVVKRLTDVEREIHAEFGEEAVTLAYANKSLRIPYNQIKEVGKVMTWPSYESRYEMEKGAYTVTIRTRWRRYVFSTPEKDYEQHLDFEETDLYQFYREFGRNGVKLC